MSRKTKATTNDLKTATTIKSEPIPASTEADAPKSKVMVINKDIHPEDPVEVPPEIDHFANIVLTGKGRKLSPKTDNDVFYDVALHDTDESLYLRLSGNEGGGLHSKEWLPLQSILDLLNEQVGKPFKSALVKPLFTGSSANNAGFLCAALRGIGLLAQSGSSVFLHQLSENFNGQCTELLALKEPQAGK